MVSRVLQTTVDKTELRSKAHDETMVRLARISHCQFVDSGAWVSIFGVLFPRRRRNRNADGEKEKE